MRRSFGMANEFLVQQGNERLRKSRDAKGSEQGSVCRDIDECEARGRCFSGPICIHGENFPPVFVHDRISLR